MITEEKTKNSRRAIPLRPSLVEAPKKLKVRQGAVKLALGEVYAPRGFVFATHSGRPLRTRNLWVNDFSKLIERAGVSRIRLHDLRHTTASFLIGRNVDPETAALILGHHDGAFTLSVDTSAIDEGSAQKPAAIARLETLFATLAAQ